MNTLIIDAPLWLRVAIYLWLIGKAIRFLNEDHRKYARKEKDSS